MSSGSSVTRLTKEPTSKCWKRHSLYIGLQSRIARALGINRATVCQVMSGKKTSARISKAIDREIGRIEREIERASERAA